MITLNTAHLRNAVLGFFVMAIGTVMLVSLGCVDANGALRGWSAIRFVFNLTCLVAAGIIWLQHLPWRGAAIRWLLIAKFATGASVMFLMAICSLLGARYNDGGSELLLGLPVDLLLLSLLVARNDWARKTCLFFAGFVVVVAMAGLFVNRTELLGIGCLGALVCYWLTRPEVKREFVWAR